MNIEPGHGQRAGLVEQRAVDAGQGEQGVAIGHQHVVPGQLAQRAGQRDRHGQRERAGAGHHQYRDGGIEGARRVDQQPAQRGQHSQRQYATNEVRDIPVAADDQGTRLAGAVGKRAKPGHAGIRAAMFDPQFRRPGQQHAAGDQPLAAQALLRPRFTGEQRLVHLHRGTFQHAIGRHRAAVRDMHAVAAGEVQRGHCFQFAVGAAALRQQRRGVDQGVTVRTSAMARAQLQVARGQQQEHEHADRIEVDLAAAAQGVDHAGGEHQRDRQRHRQVDAEAASAQFTRCAREEGSRGIEHQWNRGEQAQPAEQVARAEIDEIDHADIDDESIGHHLHRTHPGDQHALQCVMHLDGAGVLDLVMAQRPRRAAGGGEAFQQGGQRGLPGLPDDAHALCRTIDGDASYAGQGIDALFQPQHLACVLQGVDVQGDFAAAVAALAQYSGGEPGIRPGRRGVHGFGSGGAGGALRALAGTPNTACCDGFSGVSA